MPSVARRSPSLTPSAVPGDARNEDMGRQPQTTISTADLANSKGLSAKIIDPVDFSISSVSNELQSAIQGRI